MKQWLLLFALLLLLLLSISAIQYFVDKRSNEIPELTGTLVL